MLSRRLATPALVVGAAFAMAAASAPFVVWGGDHLDAPGVTGPVLGGDGRPDADLNDVFVYAAPNNRTVVTVTTHPIAGFLSPLTFGTDLIYKVNISRTGDTEPKLAYVWRFGTAQGDEADPVQPYTLERFTGANATTLKNGTVVATGTTNSAATPVQPSNEKSHRTDVWAGLRSDPFFLDLAAIRNDFFGVPQGRHLCENPVNFFSGTNVNAMVLEVPDQLLGKQIAVWAEVLDAADGSRIDREGRPAINTIYMAPGTPKDAFNSSSPSDDRANYTDAFVAVLERMSAHDTEGAYTQAQAREVAGRLLPDVLTYDTGSDTTGLLNGRSLTDDVIDAAMNVAAGGFPLGGRDAAGHIMQRDTSTGEPTGTIVAATDCVGPNTNLLAQFPYLGEPHA